VIVRLDRAIEAFLEWRTLERDATPSSLNSYYRILIKIAEDWPQADLSDFEGREGTEKLRATLARRWGKKSAATRCNVISVFHSFFDWTESEDLIETNPARRIRRPPKRKPNVHRPRVSDLEAMIAEARLIELPAILLMAGAGLRAAEVCGVRWGDIDFERQRVKVLRKGQNWQRLPLAPDVAELLDACHDKLVPDDEDYVFVVERALLRGDHMERVVRDPSRPASTKSLWLMVRRVSERAGLRPLGPHALRHGFATGLRKGGAPLDVIQHLLGHSRPDTTLAYLDEIELEDLSSELSRARARSAKGQSRASSHETT
jgi:integrase